MFEETELAINQPKNSPRIRNCMKQCRLALFLSGGTIFDGNCPCDMPEECIFELHKTEAFHKAGVIDSDSLFPDVKLHVKQLFSE